MKKVLVLLIALFAAAFALNGCAKKHTVPPVDPGVEMFEAGQYDEAREYYKAKLAIMNMGEKKEEKEIKGRTAEFWVKEKGEWKLLGAMGVN